MTDDLCSKVRPAGGYLSFTQLTALNLRGCVGLNTRALHHILIRSPALREVNFRGLHAVTNSTLNVLAIYCPHLTSLNLSRCINADGEGVREWAQTALSRQSVFPLKQLHLSGLKEFTDATMKALARISPVLQVLDLSYIRSLHNSAVEAFVALDEYDDQVESTLLTSREAGRDPNDGTLYRRRITRLRHVSFSSCGLLTDIACANLAHAVPNLEYLELAGIGGALKDAGLVHLLSTTPMVKRVDLEDACDITDAVLRTLTPPNSSILSKASRAVYPGQKLEHIVISYATNLTDAAMIALIRGCARLRVLEADNTSISGNALKEFVRVMRKRQTADAQIAAIDCRAVGENVVRDLTPSTRPRFAWRDYSARKLGFVDGRDDEGLKVGQDECDPKRVVLKSFYSWQTVDAVRAARDKRRSASERRSVNASGESISDDDDGNARRMGGGGRMRWWSPSGRRGQSGSGTPAVNFDDRDACRIM
jgi:F-box/leucine-rich repeat protein 2/20